MRMRTRSPRPGTAGAGARSRQARSAWKRPRSASRRGSGLAEHLGDEEGQLERLDAVEARVADRLVAVDQVDLAELLATADALGHVVAGELDVDAAGPRAERPVDV